MAFTYGIEQPCDECRMCMEGNYKEKHRKITNAEKIRSMGNEELAKFLDEVETAGYNDSSIAPKKPDGYPMDLLEWLESEVTE